MEKVSAIGILCLANLFEPSQAGTSGGDGWGDKWGAVGGGGNKGAMGLLCFGLFEVAF